MSPEQARWARAAPRRELPPGVLERMVAAAFPGSRVLQSELLAAGMRNANFKLRLDAPADAFVLRVYEHDVSLCRKELDLFRLVGGAVPVPEVVYAAPEGLDGLPSFLLARWIEGITFRELKHTGDREAIAQSARSAGEMLGAIGRTRFPMAGWIGPGPAVMQPLLAGRDPYPRFLDLCLEDQRLVRRVPESDRQRVHEMVWRWAAPLAELDRDPRLVHGDFNRRNLLVRQAGGQWRVAAVLDWEYSVAGSPLADVGRFLRNEKAGSPLVEPHFSEGYRAAGGALCEDWLALARLLDLAAICESLTHEDLPEAVERELVELLRTSGSATAP